MEITTYLDIAVHVIFSLIAGFIAWKFYGQRELKRLKLSIFFSFLTGVAIDFDHFLDNFIVFGLSFNYHKFVIGDYFHKTSKAYILFHGFEYIVILALIFILVKSGKTKMILLSMILGMFFHLATDIILFTHSIKEYSLFYRILHNFKLDKPL